MSLSVSSVPVLAGCSGNGVVSVVERSLSKRLSFWRLKMESKAPLSSWQTVAAQQALLQTAITKYRRVVHGGCGRWIDVENTARIRSMAFIPRSSSLDGEGRFPALSFLGCFLNKPSPFDEQQNLQICVQIRWPWCLRKSNFLVFNFKLEKKPAPHPPPCGTFNCLDVMVGDKK